MNFRHIFGRVNKIAFLHPDERFENISSGFVFRLFWPLGKKFLTLAQFFQQGGTNCILRVQRYNSR